MIYFFGFSIWHDRNFMASNSIVLNLQIYETLSRLRKFDWSQKLQIRNRVLSHLMPLMVKNQEIQWVRRFDHVYQATYRKAKENLLWNLERKSRRQRLIIRRKIHPLLTGKRRTLMKYLRVMKKNMLEIYQIHVAIPVVCLVPYLLSWNSSPFFTCLFFNNHIH